MIELEDMRYFVEVAESGGFSRAAARLGVSKSIVSRRIARIEEHLGARLLNRTTRGVTASDAGMEFKARAERLLADYDEALDAVAAHGGEVVGRLRVSAPLSFGIQHLAPVLAELAADHPRLELDVSLSDRLVDLIGERLDAAIRIGKLEDSSHVARRIAPIRSLVVASPAYLARKGRPTRPEELATDHDCLIYTGSRSPEWVFTRGEETVSVRPRGRLRSDSGETLVAWALAGLGIVQMPSFLLGDTVDKGTLVPLLLDHPLPEYGMYVVRPPGPHTPGKVRALTEALLRHFGGTPAWDRCVRHVAEAEAAARASGKAGTRG
ncbi:LysR family transcriptional regulator [Stappia sp. 28M-7]|uniref:LysR family transcriptional regulator n=1 Tax=Stappia sp. 28M-7 TaxID=2762596 RepID=UPI00163C1355|nr:LysR family transcriptional regulator [Stappia sp. 28M-7]MBC2857462.1 LysR family transcriptional regulator [Stappia sp. 28M-7]